jgi:hypothetical protein
MVKDTVRICFQLRSRQHIDSKIRRTSSMIVVVCHSFASR